MRTGGTSGCAGLPPRPASQRHFRCCQTRSTCGHQDKGTLRRYHRTRLRTVSTLHKLPSTTLWEVPYLAAGLETCHREGRAQSRDLFWQRKVMLTCCPQQQLCSVPFSPPFSADCPKETYHPLKLPSALGKPVSAAERIHLPGLW